LLSKIKFNLGVSLTSTSLSLNLRGNFWLVWTLTISLPRPSSKQIDFFKKNKSTVAIGGQCVVIDEFDNVIGNKNFPTKFNKIKDMIFWAVPLQQPSMMINLTKLPKNFTWYQPNQSSAEEINLMFRFMQYGQISNLSDNLLFYRHLNNSLSHKNP
jgi:hypothetical protein